MSTDEYCSLTPGQLPPDKYHMEQLPPRQLSRGNSQVDNSHLDKCYPVNSHPDNCQPDNSNLDNSPTDNSHPDNFHQENSNPRKLSPGQNPPGNSLETFLQAEFSCFNKNQSLFAQKIPYFILKNSIVFIVRT